MKALVTRKRLPDGTFSYDYVAERPVSGSIHPLYCTDKAEADKRVITNLRREFNEVVIFEEGFPT